MSTPKFIFFPRLNWPLCWFKWPLYRAKILRESHYWIPSFINRAIAKSRTKPISASKQIIQERETQAILTTPYLTYPHYFLTFSE